MVRPVNWTEIFQKRPDLEPPGYRQVLKQAQQARQAKAEAPQKK